MSSWVDKPQCMYMLKAKSCKDEMDYIWVGGWGLKELLIYLRQVLCR